MGAAELIKGLGLTERQELAISNPCRVVEDWGPGPYRRQVTIGQVSLMTFLSFDWFEDSKPCWHAAVAIFLNEAYLKPVAIWDHNDSRQAILITSDLIQGAGDAARGRWARKTEDGLDLYRAPTEQERLIANVRIDSMAPLITFLDQMRQQGLELAPAAVRNGANHNGQPMGHLGLGKSTNGADPRAAPRSARTVHPERIQGEE